MPHLNGFNLVGHSAAGSLKINYTLAWDYAGPDIINRTYEFMLQDIAGCLAGFPLVLECNVIHTYEIGSHTQFIGEIMDVKAEESILDENGQIDADKIQPFTFAPVLRKYFSKGNFLGKGFEIGKK